MTARKEEIKRELMERLEELTVLRLDYNQHLRDYEANVIALCVFKRQFDELHGDMQNAVRSIESYVERQYRSLMYKYKDIEIMQGVFLDIRDGCQEILDVFRMMDEKLCVSPSNSLDDYILLPVPQPSMFL